MKGYNRIVLATTAMTMIIIIALVAFENHAGLTRELSEVLMIILGMLVMTSISTALRILHENSAVPLIQISFNERKTRATLDEAITADYHEVIDFKAEKESWEVNEDDLLEQDPALALAKLRIDIERELRRIAFDNNIDVDLRHISINFLMSTLAKRGIIGKATFSAIRDILPACNEAIHGGQVTLQVARSVLDVGRDLVTLLRNTRASAIPAS